MDQPQLRQQRCENCLFWDRLTQSPSHGQCRRRAPLPTSERLASLPEELPLLGAWWPLTLRDEWCGKYQPPPIEQQHGMPPKEGAD